MCIQEYEVVVAILQRYLNIPNDGIIINSPILILYQLLHPSPNADRLRIAPDIAIHPDEAYIPRPFNPEPLNLGPSPSDTRKNSHARIVCEVAVSQNYHRLKNNCAFWMSQQYAKLWRQGFPIRKWDFGTAQKGSSQPTGCNAPGNPAYQINIPISDVFYGPPIPAIGYVPLVSRPAILGGNFINDLYGIQQIVFK
ncbi:7079_t:CDS:2, partial [Cetraspora pellucida]